MIWNWQQPDWPNFSFDPLKLMPLETAFAHESGLLLGAFTHLEYGIAEMMVNLYTHFQHPLSHQMLFDWHSMLLTVFRQHPPV